MSEPVKTPYAADYVVGQLEQAARESRAWAGVARAHARVHDAMAQQLVGERRRVALALAKVARENAAHAEKMADLYDAEVDSCR